MQVLPTQGMLLQAVWVQFAPDTGVADISTWQMYKLGRPISPLEVISNGSYSQHAVTEEGISVTGAGSHANEELNIRYVPCLLYARGLQAVMAVCTYRSNM